MSDSSYRAITLRNTVFKVPPWFFTVTFRLCIVSYVENILKGFIISFYFSSIEFARTFLIVFISFCSSPLIIAWWSKFDGQRFDTKFPISMISLFLQNCKRKWVCHLSFHIVSVVKHMEVLWFSWTLSPKAGDFHTDWLNVRDVSDNGPNWVKIRFNS